MKKIVALMLAMVIVLSCASVFADSSLWQGFFEASNVKITSGNVKMEAAIDLRGDVLEMAGIPQGTLATINYDFNMVGNEAQTKCDAEGNISIKAPMFLAEPISFDLWLKEDITDINNPQFYVILRLAEIFRQEIGVDKEYIFIDYTAIPGFEEMLEVLANLDQSEIEKIVDMVKDALGEYIDADLITEYEQRVKAVLGEINITFDGAKYIITASDAQIKSMYKALFEIVIDMATNISGFELEPADIAEAKEYLNEIFAALANVQIFDPVRGLVVEVSQDGTYMHAEINIETNLYDIIAAVDPQSAIGGEGYRGMLDVGASVKASGYITPLASDYVINFPSLTPDNTYDVMTGEALKEGETGLYYEEAPDVSIEYNGDMLALENVPVMCADRTFVPLREFANTFGISDGNIHYDEATERVTIKSGDVEIVMHIGSKEAYVNGETKMLDVPAFTHNDRTYIPVRFVSEMFKKNVDYIDLNATGQGSGLIVIIND